MHRTHVTTGLVLLLLSFALAAPAHAAILRVKADAPGPEQDGATWATAYRTVQAAVDAGPAGNEIWIAQGTYVGNIDAFWAVHLYGGFAGTETAREERDPKDQPTILDGNQAGSVIAFRESVAEATVDGLTIRNGQASRGAGIYSQIPRLTVANCAITGNSTQNPADPYEGSVQGAGLWAKNDVVVVAACIIEGNGTLGTGGKGGGMWIEAEAAHVRDNTIRDNRASEGGGIRILGTEAVIERNVIVSNGGVAGELYAAGGGIYSAATSCRIANNLVAHNMIVSGTGAFGGGIYAASGATIVNNTIVDNTAVVYFPPFEPRFDADSRGGGVLDGGLVANNVIAFNNAYSAARFLPENRNLVGVQTSRNNVIYGGQSGFPPESPEANTLADPWFVSTHPNQHDADYRLLPSSPAIDAGDDSLVLPGETDRLGKPRIAGAHVDIGAYEYAGYDYPVGPITIRDTTRALRIAAGLEQGHSLDEARLDQVGEPGRIDILDAVRLARKAAGLEPNP